jgi:hypothetical protein
VGNTFREQITREKGEGKRNNNPGVREHRKPIRHSKDSRKARGLMSRRNNTEIW